MYAIYIIFIYLLIVNTTSSYNGMHTSKHSCCMIINHSRHHCFPYPYYYVMKYTSDLGKVIVGIGRLGYGFFGLRIIFGLGSLLLWHAPRVTRWIFKRDFSSVTIDPIEVILYASKDSWVTVGSASVSPRYCSNDLVVDNNGSSRISTACVISSISTEADHVIRYAPLAHGPRTHIMVDVS